MEKTRKNKEFILEYVHAFSGVKKTMEALERYTTDHHLMEHIIFFDSVFPAYEMFVDEITAEGDRVVIRARLRGRHEGELNGIPPTNITVEVPMVVGYEIENGKIVSHWLIADQVAMLEQLGVMQAA
jgi:predicted ester cyclase